MNYKDVELVNQGLDTLSDTLLRNRMTKQEQARQQQEQQRLQQQAGATAAYRTAELGQKEKYQDVEQNLMQQRLDEEKRHNTETEKTQSTKGATGFSWKGEDGVTYKANSPQEFSQLIQQHPAANENGKHYLDMSGTDANGVTVHLRTEVPSDGGDTAKASAKNIVSQFVQFSGAVPKPKPESQVGKQEVRQVLNPAHVVGGQVDTNQPAFLSLTNTTTPMAQSPQTMKPTPPMQPKQPSDGGVRVRNKRTGQMGTQLPDGTVIPDQAPQ